MRLHRLMRSREGKVEEEWLLALGAMADHPAGLLREVVKTVVHRQPGLTRAAAQVPGKTNRWLFHGG